MAQIGGNGKGNISVELNLVPFIDLMSVCIIFLLITAVWTQVSMIQLGSSVYSKATDSGQVEPSPRPDISIRLDIKPNGYELMIAKNIAHFPLINGAYDDVGLATHLKKVKEQYPDKNDVVITIADIIIYEEAIKGMDTLLNNGFPEITVATGSME